MKIIIEMTPEEAKEMLTPNVNPQVYSNIVHSWMEAVLQLQKDWGVNAKS